MRAVLDTNVLISALLVRTSLPARAVQLWLDGAFALVSSAEQIDEFKRATRYPHMRGRIATATAGRLVNEIRAAAVMVDGAPRLALSPDPDDDMLLPTALAGDADYLVTGDKRGPLDLKTVGRTRIVTVRAFLHRAARLP
ncbi:MAG: putative toxin-antitoxin system toxin component, PIN family [Proteobacteria bacterium]|nr:putative toxin-antitoxin system toxin component, PIN family [Pseudomonadota bacterium]